MPLSYIDTSAPLREPLQLADAKTQCVIAASFTDDDAYLTRLITAARQYVEKLLHRAIFPRTMRLSLDFFPFPDYGSTVNPDDRHVLYGMYWHSLAIRLPKPRALSIQSITYIDLSGQQQTLDASKYAADFDSEPARIVPQPGIYWPYTQSYLPGSVKVNYTAGHFVLAVTESVQVPAQAPYNLPLTQISAYVGMSSLVDASNPPAPVAFSAGLTPAVNASYAGQTLTATYYTANCPETVKQAMLLLVSHWYSNRDAAASQPPKEIDLGVQALLAGEIFDTFGF
jgi:Phage gp6-like head-tail connector protein